MSNEFGTPLIRSNEITDISEATLIGEGQYGKVYKGKCRGMTVAVKIPSKQDLNAHDLQSLQKEVQIMSNLYHPNVCLFMGACLEPNNIRIVSELMVNDLSKLLENKEDKSSFSVRLNWGLEAAKGISWMHAKNPPIIHMDIKPDNILYDADGRIKVCDFGFSLFKVGDQSEVSKPTGTPLFMSPEILCAHRTMPTKITEKSDVYSFAIVLWEVLTKQKAFSHHNSFTTFKRSIISGERPPIPTYCTAALRNLLNRCWAASACDRPSFNEIVSELTNIIEEYKVLEQQRDVGTDISDAVGKHFWYSYFLYHASVSWEDFARAFCEALNTNGALQDVITKDSIQMKCLRALLMDKQENVTRKMFGKVLGWFGLLQVPYYRGGHVLDKIVETLRLPYFFGSLSGGDAASVLNHCNAGSFLVRFSGNHPNSICISRVPQEGGPVKHVVIPCRNGYFVFQDTAISTVAEVVFAAAQKCLLSNYCTSDKFSSLFQSPVTMLNVPSAYTIEGTETDDYMDQ